MEQKNLNIGKRLRQYVTEKRIYQANWARAQAIKPRTILRYFKKDTMQIATLFTICQVLKYNFLREIADQLPAEFPPHPANPLQLRVNELEEENKMLKKEIEVLEKVVGGKK